MIKRIEDAIHELFKHDGWLTKNGYNNSEEQHQYCLAALKATTLNGKLSLLEAGTGVGKSFGYLFPLMAYASLSKKRVIVATHSIALQEALMSSTLNMVRSAMSFFDMPEVTVGKRIGMQHFVDLNRVQNIYNEYREIFPQQAKELLDWASFETSEGKGLIESWYEHNHELPFNLRESDICIRPYSNGGQNQAFLSHKEDAKQNSVVFTTHMMLLSSVSNNGLGDLGQGDTVIIDEADTIHETAQEITQKHFNLTRLSKLITKTKHILTKTGKESAKTLVDEIIDFENSTTIQTNENHPFKNENELSWHKIKLDNILNLISKVVSKIKKSEQDSTLAHLLYDIDYDATYIAHSMDKYIQLLSIYQTPQLREKGYLAASLKPSMILRAYLKRKTNLICTSATLIDRYKISDVISFDGFTNKIGLQKSEIGVTVQIEPKNYGQMTLNICSKSSPKPFITGEDITLNLSWLVEVSELVNALAAKGERVLLLSSSYNETNKLKPLLHPNSHCHQKGSVSDAFECAKADNAPVFVTPSGWAGMNYRDNNGNQYFTCIVVSKIPFLPPSDVDKLKIAYSLSKDKIIKPNTLKKAEAIAQISIKEGTIKKLKQGFGRGIRSQHDNIAIFVFDPRFPTSSERGHHGYLKNAIPKRFIEQHRKARIFSIKDKTLTFAETEHTPAMVNFL